MQRVENNNDSLDQVPLGLRELGGAAVVVRGALGLRREADLAELGRVRAVSARRVRVLDGAAGPGAADGHTPDDEHRRDELGEGQIRWASISA
jgi:hypothetical protein